MVYVPLVPPAGVPDRTPVDGLKVTPLGRVPDSVKVGAGLPLAATWKLNALPTVTVSVLAEVKTGAVQTTWETEAELPEKLGSLA